MSPDLFSVPESTGSPPTSDVSISINTNSLPNETENDYSVQFILLDVLNTWSKRHYLVVFGIPSVDIKGRQIRRNLQRFTCWSFPGIARKENNFTGDMLVLYILAKHPLNNYQFSQSLKKEVTNFQDVITLSMHEGKSSTNKKIGGGGNWGAEAEIGMSRKTFLWFDLSLRLFPHVSFIAKGDDDMFLRVPQYLADLHSLPRRGVYWGALLKAKGDVPFFFMIGFCMTLARDVVEQVVNFKPLQQLSRLPYSKEREAEFISLNMDHEDNMVGRVLYETKYPHLLYVRERRCRFHNLRYGPYRSALNESSVMVHHITEFEYSELMQRFGKDLNSSPKRYRHSRGNIIFNC